MSTALWPTLANGTCRPATQERMSGRPELLTFELIRRLCDRDEAALAEVYERSKRVVYGLACRVLQDQAEAEELMIDVFLYVWKHARDFDPERSSPSSWLLMIARSRAIDRLRARKARRLAELDCLEGVEIADPANGPEQHAAQSQVARKVREALAGLPEEQRHPIELSYFEGLSHSEIAHCLGIPLGTVKTRIRSAMAQLRDVFGTGFCEELSQ